MKTTEELRKELEYWEREEYEGCLDLDHLIIPLGEQLKAAETGDLLFGDVQLQSKLAYVNDQLSNSGIPLFLARKSDVLTLSEEELALESYKQLALYYGKGKVFVPSLVYTFEEAVKCSELMEQLSAVEQQLDLLKFLCALDIGVPPYFEGQLGGELSLYVYSSKLPRIIDSQLYISYESQIDRYTVKLEGQIEWFCNDSITLLPYTKESDSKVTLQFNKVQSATVQALQEGVSSTDLQSTFDSLVSRLTELDNEDNDKVTVQVTLVTEYKGKFYETKTKTIRHFSVV